jgi:hypothetical protein
VILNFFVTKVALLPKYPCYQNSEQDDDAISQTNMFSTKIFICFQSYMDHRSLQRRKKWPKLVRAQAPKHHNLYILILSHLPTSTPAIVQPFIIIFIHVLNCLLVHFLFKNPYKPC